MPSNHIVRVQVGSDIFEPRKRAGVGICRSTQSDRNLTLLLLLPPWSPRTYSSSKCRDSYIVSSSQNLTLLPMTSAVVRSLDLPQNFTPQSPASRICRTSHRFSPICRYLIQNNRQQVISSSALSALNRSCLSRCLYAPNLAHSVVMAEIKRSDGVEVTSLRN